MPILLLLLSFTINANAQCDASSQPNETEEHDPRFSKIMTVEDIYARFPNETRRFTLTDIIIQRFFSGNTVKSKDAYANLQWIVRTYFPTTVYYGQQCELLAVSNLDELNAYESELAKKLATQQLDTKESK